MFAAIRKVIGGRHPDIEVKATEKGWDVNGVAGMAGSAVQKVQKVAMGLLNLLNHGPHIQIDWQSRA